MRRLWPWIFTGLFLGGIAHIASILLMPVYSGQDATMRLSSTSSINQVSVLPQSIPGKSLLPFMDPNAVYAVCPYDLSVSPLRIAIPQGDIFLSVSFLKPGGSSFYALTDQAGRNGALDIRLITQEQLTRIETLDVEDQPIREIRVKAPSATGVMIARALASDKPHMQDAELRAQSVSCLSEPIKP